MTPCIGVQGKGSEDYEACVRSVARMELRGKVTADRQFKNVMRAYPTVTPGMLRADIQAMKARWLNDDEDRLRVMRENKAKGDLYYYCFELHNLPIDTAIEVQTAIIKRYNDVYMN